MSELVAGPPATSPNLDDPDDLDDLAPSTEAPPVRWIAAYAMGVAASGRHEYGAVELVRHAGGDAQALGEARRHLDREEIGDPRLRREASALLTAAEAQAGTDGPDLIIRLDR